MRSNILVWLIGGAAIPAAIGGGIASLDPVTLDEDSDLMTRAQEIAREQFSARAELTVLGVTVRDERIGTFGERIRPDPGYAFHVVNVRIENVGKMDLAVSTWHFSGLDEVGSDHSVELGNAHEDFDASRLGRGHARSGIVIFELWKDSFLTGVAWQGDLAEANTTVPAYPRV